MTIDPHSLRSAENTLRNWYANRSRKVLRITRMEMHDRLLEIMPSIDAKAAHHIINRIVDDPPQGLELPVTHAVSAGPSRAEMLAASIVDEVEGRRERVSIAVTQANEPSQSFQCSVAFSWHHIASMAAMNAHARFAEAFTAAEIIETAGFLCAHYAAQVKKPGT